MQHSKMWRYYHPFDCTTVRYRSFLHFDTFMYINIAHTWFVRKVSELIFLCTNWQCSTSLMYISTLGSDFGCMSILVSTGLVDPVVRYCCLCMVVFSNLVTFAMQENIEQCYAIKFCVKLNKSATETFNSLIEAYGDAAL